ncbi:hypothetical protein [Ktedonosporobacter rubrisoli]|uniref:hypothetical protein n=1 Tax=Ktedonosporobacter rubrisoli TaxID=2509675 RepID=UPI001A9204DB|nr:hypothetical protein [Ktedonosporobacter rubrisoli]
MQVRTIGVIGAGVMGIGVAQVLAQHLLVLPKGTGTLFGNKESQKLVLYGPKV